MDLPRVSLGKPRKVPGNSHSLLEFSASRHVSWKEQLKSLLLPCTKTDYINLTCFGKLFAFKDTMDPSL